MKSDSFAASCGFHESRVIDRLTGVESLLVRSVPVIMHSLANCEVSNSTPSTKN